MIDIVYKTGKFVVTAILYTIPILTACSFIYDWGGFFQVVLIGASMTEYYSIDKVPTIIEKVKADVE